MKLIPISLHHHRKQTILGKLMCGLQTVCKPDYVKIFNSPKIPKKPTQSVSDILIFR